MGNLGVNDCAGVYAFFRPSGVDQCGSCINFDSRLYNHYVVDIRNNPNQPFYHNAIASGINLSIYQFVPFYGQPDWETLYKTFNPNYTPEQEYIVRAFLQQAIRTVEQTYSSYVRPTYYNDVTSRVKVWHINWIPGTVLPSNRGYTVLWILPDGTSGMSPSVKAASSRFGLSYSTIKTLASQGEYTYINTSKEGKVGFLYKDLPAVVPQKKALNIQVDYSKLKTGLVYVFDSEINLLPGSPYANISEAAVAIFFFFKKKIAVAIGLPPKATLHSVVNIDQPVKAPALGDGAYVYLVRRAKLMDFPVTLTSLTADNTLVTHEFETMGKAKVALGGVKLRSSAVSYILNERTVNGWVIRFKQQDTCIFFLKEDNPSVTVETLADLSVKLSTVPSLSILTMVGKPLVFDDKLKVAHTRKGIVATDKITGESMAYESIMLAARMLSPDGNFPGRNTLVRRHIKNGYPYHNYLFRYWDPSKDVGITMVREDREKRNQFKVNTDTLIIN